jgi:hypothetical protein
MLPSYYFILKSTFPVSLFTSDPFYATSTASLDIKTEAAHDTAVTTIMPHDTAAAKSGRNPEEIFDDFHRFEPLDEEEEELLLLLNNTLSYTGLMMVLIYT